MRSFRFLAILVSALLLNATLILLAAIPLQGQPQKLYVPALVAEGAGIGIALVNPTLMEAAVTLTARSYNGELIQNGIVNPATLILPASGQRRST